MTYREALSYLHSFLNFEKISQFSYRRELNLKRMKAILSWFRNPQNQFRSVSIAGTKGKGSTAFFLERLLSSHGFRTGLYTSPHLSDFRERIRIGTEWIAKDDFSRLMSRIKRVVERRKKSIRRLGSITFFELSTTLAFLYFEEQKIDWAVLEVGMGGRLDATNVVKQSLSVITLIGMDHEEHLGHTLKLIAKEKAAIIKSSVPVICAEQKQEALKVIQTQAKKYGAPVYLLNRDFRATKIKLHPNGSKFNFQFRALNETVILRRSRRISARRFFAALRMTRVSSDDRTKTQFNQLELALPGSFQVRNASVALAAFESLADRFGFHLKSHEVYDALRRRDWWGRFEIIKRGGITYILDSAHNPESIRAASEHVRRFFKRKTIVTIFGISREKNARDLYAVLSQISDMMIITKAPQPRSQDPKTLVEQIEPRGIYSMSASLREALDLAQRISEKKTVILITGSLFLVGEARKLLA